MMTLRGKTFLVTGGAVRIGRRIVEALAGAGGRVVIHYRRSRREAEALAETLTRSGHTAWAVEGRLDTEAECRGLIDRAYACAGTLDGLVNNAALFRRRTLAETDEAMLLADLRVNLLAPLFLIRALAGRSSAGRVVNLLDRRIAGLEPGALAYQLSKRGLADLTRLAALELAPGFTVNAVAPGPVLPPAEGDGRIPDRAGPTPLNRRPTPDDVAQAVLFLLAAESVTGQILFVDGGQHLAGRRA